jgi:hypothetical protein
MIIGMILNRLKYGMHKNNDITLEQLLANHPILLEQVERDHETLKTILFHEVDESNFLLSDWLKSLNVLYEWLERSGLTLSLQNGIGYVSCVAKSVDNSSTLNHLPSLVHDFLEQYGCELAVKK